MKSGYAHIKKSENGFNVNCDEETMSLRDCTNICSFRNPGSLIHVHLTGLELVNIGLRLHLGDIVVRHFSMNRVKFDDSET